MAHVPHLYLPGPWVGETVAVAPAQLDHLVKVLRRDPDGSPASYTDGSGVIGEGILRGGAVERGPESEVSRGRQLTLAVAPPRNRDRQRFLVEKLGELGVTRLVWLATTHGSGRPPAARKSAEWAVSALEQARGAWLMHTDDRLVGWDDLEKPVVACDAAGDVDPGDPATVAVGPEGGWSPGEVPENARSWRLGDTILRVETAALVAVARLSG
jgi:16S rRNA U1498 N3-methylase RsmE